MDGFCLNQNLGNLNRDSTKLHAAVANQDLKTQIDKTPQATQMEDNSYVKVNEKLNNEAIVVKNKQPLTNILAWLEPRWTTQEPRDLSGNLGQNPHHDC